MRPPSQRPARKDSHAASKIGFGNGYCCENGEWRGEECSSSPKLSSSFARPGSTHFPRQMGYGPFIWPVTIFETGSLICGVAQNVNQLIVGRPLAGWEQLVVCVCCSFS
jgi:hypothetical protein